MSSSVVEKDKKSRERIVEELYNNFFVEASAGSGKTTSLVFRMVALVEDGVDVNKICTITFTKAAAAEFFNRFQALLSVRSVLVKDKSDKVLGEKNEKTVKRCQEALNNIDSCFLGTIDAFCNMIAHELPSEVDIPSDAVVIGVDEYLGMIEGKFIKILKDVNDPLHSKALRFKDSVESYKDALTLGVKNFLESRHTHIDYKNDLVKYDAETYLAKVKPYVLDVISDLIEVDNCVNADAKIKAQEQLKSSFYTLSHRSWNKCLTSLKYALSNILKMSGFNQSIIGTPIEQYVDVPQVLKANSTLKYTETFTKKIEAIQKDVKEYVYQVCLDFVCELSKRMEVEFKNEGKLQYFDFLYYLNKAFKESANGDRELINHILKRHSFFLLDESQDTNPLQTEMFFYLTGTVKDNDWKKVKPKEGSLFIVGDPKQSIYSFRDANVSAYLENEKIFENEQEVLVLTKNFRSNVQLRDWFNGTMDKMLNSGPEALRHLEIPIEQEERDEEKIPSGVLDGVYKYLTTKTDEPRLLAQLITSFVGKQKIYSRNEDGDEPKKKERLIRYSDFMIVPRGTFVGSITSAFDEYHIPYTVEANIPFTASKSFVAIRDLTELVKSPYDIGKFLKVAHGDLYKLNEKEIILLKNSGFDLNISHPHVTNDQKLDEMIQELNELYNDTYGMGFSSTMLYIVNNKKLNIFERVPSTNLEYTLFLIQKIKEKEEDGSLTTVKQLKAFIDNFQNGSDDQRSLRFKDKVDRVKISNVHKVKGLQAPIVILVMPSKKKRTSGKHVDYSIQPPATYFSKISELDDDFREVKYAETSRFDSEAALWEQYDDAENKRLEYVGATRAESVLIVGRYDKINSDYYNPWKDLWESIDDNNTDLPINNDDPEELTKVNVDLGDYNINKDSHDLTHKFVSPSLMRTNKVNNNDDEIDDTEFEKGEKKDATLLGTIAHRLMECLISSKNKYSDEDVLNKICNEYGVEKYRELLAKILGTVRNGGYPQKKSTLDDDILNTLLSAKQAWCETPFSYLSKEGNIVSGVIDVFYLDQEGKYHVIDYKTNDDDNVENLETHYEEQLKSYIYALRKMGIEADAHIYHINLK